MQFPLTQERLKELLEYDPETGLFYRKTRPVNHVHIGDIAGNINKTKGYVVIGIDKKWYKGHRLAFLYMTGSWPEDQVDHINGIRHDNRWSNLRECNHSQNMQNQRVAHNGTKSGLLGVFWNETHKIWEASIQLDGKSKYLGRFYCKFEAHKAYINHKIKIHKFSVLQKINN